MVFPNALVKWKLKRECVLIGGNKNRVKLDFPMKNCSLFGKSDEKVLCHLRERIRNLEGEFRHRRTVEEFHEIRAFSH